MTERADQGAMGPVFQTRLPVAPWAAPHTRRLPGTQPLDPADWLQIDDAYAGQMAQRDHLIASGAPVHALNPVAADAAAELLDLVLTHLPRLGFSGSDVIMRPDGVAVPVDRQAPLLTLGRLCQEDFCILQKQGDEHVLTGAILCFPSGWTLTEKLMRPLTSIHVPVPDYDEGIARRVQRLFDGIQVDRPLWRANILPYEHPRLFAPQLEDLRRRRTLGPKPFLRSERQCLLRLPVTGAVIFSIHTYMLRMDDLPPEIRAGVATYEVPEP
ncbi:heme-dependent oxidative N-demethylase family protein [Halodurantibacterium flavum]|uniref:DUF3445 domain-containing protein n=1 Tax=Halodurantibacterium flavum TaxID=1382802 RepID=A0ABW4S424_9RHOB